MKVNVGKLITSAIEFRGLSQKQVASDLGIHYTTFNNYANGTREPDFEILVEIFRYLEIDLNKSFHLTVNDRDYSLSKDEVELLKLYRTLDPIQQKRMLGVCENIVNMATEKY